MAGSVKITTRIFLFKKGTNAERMLPEFDKMLDLHVAPVLKTALNLSMEDFKKTRQLCTQTTLHH